MLMLIFLHVVSNVVCESGWSVTYSRSHICALKGSTVTMSCSYKYPSEYKLNEVFWVINPVEHKEPPDLSEDPEYSQRLQYLGDKQKICTMRLNHVTLKDSHWYYFRFITNTPGQKWLGSPGVSLTVTDLQLESPETVTEGDSVTLTCKTSCALTDGATFIWSRDSQKIYTGTRVRNTLVFRVRREDAGRYRCAVDGHHLTSDAHTLTVTYPPKNVSVSISPSGEISEGSSVSLICDSDSNPPPEISWFKGGTSVGSGRIFIISNISSDDSGEYKCRAANEHGEKYSDTATVNVMYPPRSVSVLINGSAGTSDGSSVSLICVSDSNPPALNFSWFEENQSSSVGSGQSFTALQSGLFYCQAHSRYGSQRSNAVSVTVYGRSLLFVAAGASGGLGVLLFILIVVFIKRKLRAAPVLQKQNDLYINVTDGVSAHDGVRSDSESANQNDGPYALITLRNFRGDRTEAKASDSEDTDEIQYATVLHHRDKQMGGAEGRENLYDNIRTWPTRTGVRSEVVEDHAVIYSTVK